MRGGVRSGALTFRRGAEGPISAKFKGDREGLGSRARPQVGGTNWMRQEVEITHREAAEYIASLLEELKLVAKRAEMPFLAYLIAVALEEAKNEKANGG